VTVLDRIVRFLEHSDVVILRAEVAAFGSTAQAGRVLAKFVDEKRLVRASVGVYAETPVNKCTHELTPVAPRETVAHETFRKLGISVSPGRAAREHNAGRMMQVSVQPAVHTGRRRITRRIGVGSRVFLSQRSSID